MSRKDVVELYRPTEREIIDLELQGIPYRIRRSPPGEPEPKRERTPEQLARRREYARRWRAAHPDEARERGREWGRRRRYPDGYREVRVIGSLHDGGCTGVTRETGCRCERIMVTETLAEWRP